MMRRLVHRFMLALATVLLITTVGSAAQKEISGTPSHKGHAPVAAFQLDPGAIRPTSIDAFSNRPIVKSPDGAFGVTVTGPKMSYEAWVTISPSRFPDGPVQVWPLQATADVLWRPDSRAFALTDYRYSNLSYVLVCGTEFRMGESGEGLGVPITDLTPVVRKAFEDKAEKYYKTENLETLLFYASILRWVDSSNLLVGVSARTLGPSTFPNQGQKEWDFAYLVDVQNRKVVQEFDKQELLSKYRIRVPD